jgi:hypothetical protein
MPGAPSPPILLKAIAALAASGGLPGNKTDPMPETSTGSNAASVEGGFPAVTMQNELAGGKPPLGQDMNGLFFLVSSHTLYVECGQTYKYNSTLATSIGGYLSGTILGMTDETGLWLCTTDGTISDPDAGGAGWVPIAAYGKTTVNSLTGGTVTLTPAQSKYGVIVLNGVLTGNLNVNLPQTLQQWLIINNTSGAFSTTVKTAAGGSVGVVVPQGGFVAPMGVYSVGDGNIYPTVAPVNLPIDQNPNPLTIVQRTNAGYVLSTYFNGNSGLENPTVGAVIVQNAAADGFFRKIGLTNFEAQVLLQGLAGQLVNAQVPFSVISQWASALFASPALTGVPTVPTAGAGTNTTQAASTAFVQSAVGGSASFTSNALWAVLPGGLVVQAGVATSVGGNGSVSFGVTSGTRAFPNKLIAAIPINVAGGAVQTWLGSVGAQAFTFSTTNSGTASNYWIAVGY